MVGLVVTNGASETQNDSCPAASGPFMPFNVASVAVMTVAGLVVTAGKGPLQALVRFAEVSHVEAVTLVDTGEPEPGPTGPGPVALPHQLHEASTAPALSIVLFTPEVSSLLTSLLSAEMVVTLNGIW
jgi:hypothetical protein